MPAGGRVKGPAADFVVRPGPLASGTVSVPGDKSISHRALMLGAIAEGTSRISGFLAGEDCLATLAALEALGVGIRRSCDAVTVAGVGMQGLERPAADLDLGNSGTAMRLFAGLLCGQSFDATLTGDASLSARPMARVIDPLGTMGALIDSRDGKPPLTVHGGRPLTGIDYALPVASAQVKSALLLAALYARGDTIVREPAPSRDHTERMLGSMGAELEIDAGRIRIPGPQTLRATDVDVPADLSSAAFLAVAALMAPGCRLVVENVGVNPTRSGALEILRQMGAELTLENERLSGREPVADLCVRSSDLHGIEVDPALVPLAIDEFPLLFVAAAAARGRTRFRGIGELRVKESDRIAAMAAGLRQLGVRVDESADGAIVTGGTLQGGTVESRGDHRIAMAFAVAGTVATAPVRILDTRAVDTSFPGFVEVLRALGGDIDLVTVDAA